MLGIHEATNELYQAFRDYEFRDRIDTCAHCTLDAAEAALRVRPLREMTWDDFGVYPFKAITTFGDVEDYKHFLPRILDLYVADPDGARYDPHVIFEKLDCAKWGSWRNEETDAIRACVRCWLDTLIQESKATGEDPWHLEDLRSALSEFKVDIEAERPGTSLTD